METGRNSDNHHDCFFTDFYFYCFMHGKCHVYPVLFRFPAGERKQHSEADGTDGR